MTRNKKINKVMFVCSGNTCRSPMAEYLFKDLCEKNQLKIGVTSRGICTAPSKESYRYWVDEIPTIMMPEAINAVKKFNPKIRDMKYHTSTQLTIEDIASSDLILTMEEWMREDIIIKGVRGYIGGRDELEKRVFSIKEYVGMVNNPNISDPLGAGHIEIEPINIPILNKLPPRYIFDPEQAKLGYINCGGEILECLTEIINYIKHPIKSSFQRMPINEILQTRNERRQERIIKARLEKMLKELQPKTTEKPIRLNLPSAKIQEWDWEGTEKK